MFQALDVKAVKQINGKATESLTLNGVRFMFLRVAEEDDGTYQIYCESRSQSRILFRLMPLYFIDWCRFVLLVIVLGSLYADLSH